MTKTFAIGVGSVIVLFASICLGATAQTDPWTILPGGRAGSALTNNSSESDLKRIYGARNVTTETITDAEGNPEEYTVLFKSDPQRTLMISYVDTGKRHPDRVMFTGKKSMWKTIHGVTVGMTLKELEAINQKPFRVACFCTDQPGIILSFEGGSLAELDQQPNKVWLQLVPDCQPDKSVLQRNKRAIAEVTAKGGLSSDPGFQALNPCVDSISFLFPLVN